MAHWRSKKVVQVVQIRGEVEVIWTKSKRTATFFRETVPNIDNLVDVEKTLFFYHQPNWHCVRHNIAPGTTIAWGFIVLVAGIFAFWPLLFPAFFFKVTLICLKSKICILLQIKTSLYLPRWPLGTAKSLDPSV